MPTSPGTAGLGRFLLGVGSWFGSFGLHGVLFSALLVVELREDEIRVGAAQSAIMIPAVAFMLIGGTVADHVDRRRLLLALHAVASVLASALAAALFAGWLSYGILIAYAVTMGTLQAFINPARDSLLSEVVEGELDRPVALMNLIQWGSQGVGAFAGAASRDVGVAPLLLVQAAILLAGVVAYAHRPVQSTAEPSSPRPPLTLSVLTGGIREVARSRDLLASWILVCGVGTLFIGPFMVVLPLMVRDVYGGGAAEIAWVSTAFPAGTIVGSAAVMRLGGFRDPMRAQWIALWFAASILITLSLGLPFGGIIVGIGVWGLAGSVFMITGRTIFQVRASEANRGRVLATYTMGFMGAAGLVGAPVSGLLVGAVGPLLALRSVGVAMFLLVAAVAVVYQRAERSSRPESA